MKIDPAIKRRRQLQREYCRRRRQGIRTFDVRLGNDDVAILVDRGLLPQARVDDRAAVASAVVAAIQGMGRRRARQAAS